MKFVLYTSALDQSKYDPSIVSDIIRHARKQNVKHSITGVLLFDGSTFTQYIEGQADGVDRLMEKILLDERHNRVFIITVGATQTRLYDKWELGYIDLTSQTSNPKNIISKKDLNVKAFHKLIDRFVVG
jgi:hypothetical protein